MKGLDYTQEIKESICELKALEACQTKVRLLNYVRFLRYLKDGSAANQTQSSGLVGLTLRQGQRIWSTYKRVGLTGLLKPGFVGTVGNLSYVEISHLQSFLRNSETDLTQEQIGDWIGSSFGVHYGQSGISKLLKRLKIKLKTGRPVNIRQKEGDVDLFKKSLVKA